MSTHSLVLEANQLIAARTDMALATIMSGVDTIPFCSWVPYVLSLDGTIVLLLSEIAQHTLNIQQNSHVSALIAAGNTGSSANTSRVSVQAQVQLLEKNSEAGARYCRYFPQSKGYLENLDFSFYRLLPESALVNMGFGQAQWIRKNIVQSSPFTEAEELHMIEHMNSDHSDAIRHYCDKVSINIASNSTPEIVGICAHGFHVGVQEKLHWFAFNSLCLNVTDVREELVAMARS